MYVFKNALRNITRAKGRSILIFILVLVIAISACVALSIKTSADEAQQSAYDELQVTATISTNREALMSGVSGDSDAMMEMMELMSQTIALDELSVYAEASTVYDFYYSASIGVDAEDEDFSSYSLDTGNSQSSADMGGMMDGGMSGGMSLGMSFSSGDFTVVAYSSHNAMTSFIDGTLTISDGAVFDEDDTANSCVISEEISLLNELSVGDTISMVNTLNEDEIIEFTIAGIFSCESSDVYANEIYISYSSFELIVENSVEVATTYTNEMSGEEESTEFTAMPSATFVFASPDDYETFQTEIETLGFDTEVYSVSSTDIYEFEDSLVPLQNLSTFTMVFLLVVLAIGAVILIVFNLFTIRERKYEIGVLAAIGMPKPKVALQFLTEVIVVTFIAVLVGAGIGSVIANPLGDMLLENQISSTESSSSSVSANFGGNFTGEATGPMASGGGMSSGMGMESSGMFGGMFSVDYIDSINTSTNFLVLLQLLGIGLALSVVASSVGIISILRYEPLKILSERT